MSLSSIGESEIRERAAYAQAMKETRETICSIKAEPG